MARQFKKEDIVSFIGKSGKTVLCEVEGYATNGMVSLITREGGKMVSLWERDLTLVESAQSKPVTPAQQKRVFRWKCLECGRKHNAYECPSCGSDEKIHNTDSDTDTSTFYQDGRAEKYAPGE